MQGFALTGWPKQTGQTFELGSAPNSEAQPQKALVVVLSCTCVSMPITASYSTWAHTVARKAAEGAGGWQTAGVQAALGERNRW